MSIEDSNLTVKNPACICSIQVNHLCYFFDLRVIHFERSNMAITMFFFKKEKKNNLPRDVVVNARGNGGHFEVCISTLKITWLTF